MYQIIYSAFCNKILVVPLVKRIIGPDNAIKPLIRINQKTGQSESLNILDHFKSVAVVYF